MHILCTYFIGALHNKFKMVVKRLTTLLTVAVAILAKVGPKNLTNKLASISRRNNEMSKQMININELCKYN